MPNLGSIVPDMGINRMVSEALFTRTQARVLGILFAEPRHCFYLSEILTLANGGSGAIRRELDKLVVAGLVKRIQQGNRQYYQADSESSVFDELHALVVKLSARHKPATNPCKIGGTSALCRKHGVRRLGVFGSAARGDMKAGSDLDLLVEFMPDKSPTLAVLTRLRDEFESLFGCRVDLATPAILNNPHRRKAIEKDMEVIYERKGSRVPVGHAQRRN